MPNDLTKLQGVWHIQSLEMDGQTMAAGGFGEAKIIIQDDKFTSTGMGAEYEGTVTLHQTMKPKGFDLLFTTGPQKGTRNLGIYKLDKDRWTICLATYGKVRPKRFATKAESGFALETLVRGNGAHTASKGKTQPKHSSNMPSKALQTKGIASATSGTPTVLEGEWTMVEGIFSGKAMDKSMLEWCKRITHGNVTTVVAGPQTMLKASFTLNDTKSPKAVDYVNLTGANAGKSQSGIYESSGKTLKICMSAPGKPRPKDFSSLSQDGRSYTTWRLTGT